MCGESGGCARMIYMPDIRDDTSSYAQGSVDDSKLWL
jgi:hypothetical protein